MERVDLKLGQVLYEPGGAQRHAYFPTGAIVSLVHVLSNGASAEIAVVGNEGIVGTPLLLGSTSTTSHGSVRIAGQGFRIGAQMIRDELQGNEVVLVCEMHAGWYRYVSQWRLGANGTIGPRLGFAAVESQCVCNVHHHHVYWRLDFDIRTAANNRVREFNDPPLVGSSNWHTKAFEIRRPRDFGRKRKWRVENTLTREAYDIVPNVADGVAATAPDAPFGRGDLWVLRYLGSEVDDGVVAIGPPYEADLDQWVNGEAVSDHDVVVWYGAHFTHDVQHDGAAQHGHIVGPDLVPVNW